MPEHRGIAAYACYLPHHLLVTNDLDRPPSVVDDAAAHGRSVAGYDEDAITMAVEVLRGLVDLVEPDARLLVATTEAPYETKTSATIVHEASGLPSGVAPLDLRGQRAGLTALALALGTAGVVALADLRTTRPGAPGELAQGDAAAAFVGGSGAADVVASATVSVEVLDRWRMPGARHEHVWDERFTADVLVAAAREAVEQAMATAGLTAVDHVVVSSANPRAAAALRRDLKGSGADALVERRTGFTGAAHPGLLLAATLDVAEPGETILLVSASEGADALVLRVGDAVRDARRGPTVAEQLDQRVTLTYGRYLRWRGLLDVQGPARPESPPPAAPPVHRRAGWKYRLEALRCAGCGQITTPPAKLCAACGRPADPATPPVSLRERVATLTSVTQDRLTTMPEPPVAMVVADFDGGGRLTAYATDVEADDVSVGMRVTPTFRRLWTTDGIHNYFWKLQPERGAGASEPTRGSTDGD
jgi:hydroxymethylglutaryl-CoA synthase